MRAMIRIFFFMYLLVVLMTFSARGELVDKIVAIVNDDIITLSELDDAVEPFERDVRSAQFGPEEEARALSKLRSDLLNKMIDRKLTDQESARLGINISDIEIDRRIEDIKERQRLTDEQLKIALENEGRTIEEYRQWLKEQLARADLVNLEVKSRIAITEKEIQKYYEENKAKYEGKAKYRIYSILVNLDDSSLDDNADRAKVIAEEALARLKAGDEFESVAKEYSEDNTAKYGGDLGWFLLEELSSEVQQVVSQMKENELSSVLKTQHGYQILMLKSIKTEPGQSLDDVRGQIQDELYNRVVEEKYEKWLEGLRARSHIRIMD